MNCVAILTLICCPALVWSHARLMSPPSRSSMWRLGFPTKKNFNDNALYCGGITVQWQKNGGKCGICGDPYNMPHPRDNEAGGKYGRGIISKRYASGQVIQATVDVTTNHRGYFEFKLCPNNNPKKEATQECLDKYILREAYGTGNRYYIGDRGNGDITVKLQLPKGLTCSQCVFQWTYVAGNNWGKCEDGESRLGCGPQETFRGCADIAIDKSPDIFNVKPNENDVGNKRPTNSHKSKNDPQDTSSEKPLVYISEVTEQSHQQGNGTIFEKNHNSSHHHNHSSSDQDSGSFGYKNGDVLPPPSEQPGRSKEKKPVLNERRFYYVYNRQKPPKYDYRHFSLHNNSISFRQVSFDRGFFVNVSNRLPTGMGQTHYKFGNGHLRRKHNAERPKPRQIESRLHLMTHNKTGDDVSLSNGFSLGGRRYRDFWLLL